MLVPKILATLPGYHRRQFLADLGAGITVGIVALPLAIAFAIASGVTPDRGLYTAVIAGFLISLLGGSRVQIGGPTGAFVVIVYGIVQQHGIDGLLVANLMAGVILVGFGVARLGAAIKFIPYPVTVGFTSGIALLIFSSQINDILGLRIADLPAEFLPKWQAYGGALDRFNLGAIGIALGTIVIIQLWPRVSRRIPGPFVALLVTALLVRLVELPVETIGDRFGPIHAGLPMPAIPHVDLAMIPALIGPAFTIAALAAIESLLSAVVADGMIGGRHRSNMELVAQGIANIASPLFGGIPATGAIARTATNVKNGGRTPVAGMIHAVTLLLITLFFGTWAAMIPMATLGGILVVVAWHMSEVSAFRRLLRSPRSDVLVLIATFLLTVLVDLTVAIQVGLVLAAFLFMKRMAEVTNVTSITGELADPAHPSGDLSGAVFTRTIPAGVEVYEINGPFFFGAAESFRNAMMQVADAPAVLIIRMRHVPAIDATGLHALQTLIRQMKSCNTRVLFAEIQPGPCATILASDLSNDVAANDLMATFDDALAMAATLAR
ncbi:MAG: SulP family inorganic anion transporter [Gemmatimonadales bacterium]|nr:SulP family inorganic anion transporter [Gemmatimonadales bacterium]MDZ4390821.1 SulP family inorganic anion transporter [Gemmatimonadales bacterium]